MKNQFGIATLECFPFTKKIGFTEHQIPLIEKCLQGVTTLKEALAQVDHTDYKEVGISNRFLKTAGFHTILIDWKASSSELVRFLSHRLNTEEQLEFLNKVRLLKKKIAGKGIVKEFYCSKEISNTDCLAGYKNLVAVRIPPTTKRTGWHEIMITHSSSSSDKPNKLILGFNELPAEMENRILKDPYETWKPKKKMYEAIQEKYGKPFKEKLQLENLICAAEITLRECKRGAVNLLTASQSTEFRLKTQAAENTTLAVKLEKQTKNNASRLRAVCDLQGLSSALCAKAFKAFIRFVKNNRDYQVALPWDTLMFIDGAQIARVNFALNSSSQSTYLYIDANSNDQQFSNFLQKFRSQN